MSGYYCYRSFGLLIHSEIELPELPATDSLDAPDVVIRRGAVPRDPQPATLREELAIHVSGVSFLIRDGCEITVGIRSEVDPAALRVLLLGRVMAFLFRQRGWLPLHASGVVIEDQCTLFLGLARAGKSTIAAAFHKCGHFVITDDVAPVRLNGERQCLMQSSWPHLRLRQDSQALLDGSQLTSVVQAEKRRYDLSGRSAPGHVYTVRCAYVLEYGGGIRAEPVDPMRAIPLLSQCSFTRHERMTREALQAHLRDCSLVAHALPVRRLIRPSSFAELPELVHFVAKDLQSFGSAVNYR